MLQLIKNLFKNCFKKDSTSSDKTVDEIASIRFDLQDNEMISIKCYIPDLTDITEEEITSFAENYAQLLANINDGKYNQSILKIIKDNINPEDHKEVLLFNNILSFWAIYHAENKKNISKNRVSPMIKPSQVFKRQ
jgi:hypothetical protein